MRRAVGIVLSIVLLALVGGALYMGLNSSPESGQSGSSAGGKLATIRGLSGSEKKPFFSSEEVRQAFADKGYVLEVDYAGSREIADQDLSKYDFVFPASSPSAERIKTKHKALVKKTFTPFFTPMAIATWEPIVKLLGKNGVVKQQEVGSGADARTVPMLDVKAYLELAKERKRWNQLKDGTKTYDANKAVLVSTTDVRKSNSAAMYLALTSYVANSDAVVNAPEQQKKVMPVVGGLFLDQGFVENTSSGPFGSYLTVGMGKTPMVFAYEAQYLARQMAKDGSIQDSMRLMYPSPTIMSKQVFVSTSDQGSAVGQLLQEDKTLGKLAAKFGFRPDDPGVFAQALKEQDVPVPPQLVNVVSPPSYETLESMIETIAGYYKDEPVPHDSGSAATSTPGSDAPSGATEQPSKPAPPTP